MTTTVGQKQKAKQKGKPSVEIDSLKNFLPAARDAFGYISSGCFDVVKSGASLPSRLYVVFLQEHTNDGLDSDIDKTIGVLPIPLEDTYGAEERVAVASTAGQAFADRGLKVLMFLIVAEAWMTIGKKKKEAFIFVGKDYTGAIRYENYEIKRKGDNDASFVQSEMTGQTGEKWVTGEKEHKNAFPLLDTAWDRYRTAMSIIAERKRVPAQVSTTKTRNGKKRK